MLDLDGTRPASMLALRDTSNEELDKVALRLGVAPGMIAAAPPSVAMQALVAFFVAEAGRVALSAPEDPAFAHAVLGQGRSYVDVGRRHDLRIDMDALRFVLADQEMGLVWMADPPGPAAAGPSSQQLARLESRTIPLVVDRRLAADGGFRPTRGGFDSTLLLSSPPSAEPSRSAVVMLGKRSQISALRKELPPDFLLPPLVDALDEARQVARRSARAVRALVPLLDEIPGLVVSHGRAAYVYVRLPGCTAVEIRSRFEARAIRVRAFPGPRAREGVRLLAPEDEASRVRVVGAIRELVRAS